MLVWCMLTNLGDQQLDHYSFSDLKRLAAQDDETVVAKATMYLSNQRIQVLQTCLMYEVDGFFYELPEEEVKHYARGEEVFHPEFGEPIDTDDIMVCFTPGPRLQRVAAR